MRALVVLIAATAACTSISGAADLSVAPAAPDPLQVALTDAGSRSADGSHPGDPSVVPPLAEAGTGIDGGTASGPFDFVDVVNANLNDKLETSAIVAGFAGSLAATISGPGAELRVTNGPWKTTMAVTAGDSLQIRLTSSDKVSTATRATVTIGSIVVDWVVTTAAACPPQTVNWSVGAAACTLPSGALLNPGASRALNDSTVPTTGKVTITCSKGVLALTNSVCEPLKVLDVGGATGCVNGQCLISATAFSCTPDPVLATEICAFKGYAAATTFTTVSPEVGAGTLGAPACRANGTGCLVDDAAKCNLVFGTVTCRY